MTFPTMTQPTTPEGYMPDSQGRLVPKAHIKQVDLDRDSLVRELAAEAIEINERLRKFRERAHGDIQAFAELSAERYGAKLGGRKGNLTLTTFDGSMKIVRAIADVLVFDERLQAAKALIDACLAEWVEGTRTEVRTLIGDAFKVDREGKIDTARVLSLRRLEIHDERWQRAMTAISDSLRVATSRSYIRVYRRIAGSDEYTPINLDLANA